VFENRLLESFPEVKVEFAHFLRNSAGSSMLDAGLKEK
jgi:hypothetical protein